MPIRECRQTTPWFRELRPGTNGQRPVSDGGSEINSWLISINPGSEPYEPGGVADYGDHLAAQVPVEYGISYRMAVAAGNDVGVGPYSAPAAPATPRPMVTITSTNTTEGNTGSHPIPFAVKLDSPSAQPVTVSYATGKQGAGTDFVATSGTLTFAVGQSAKTITVPILGDTVYEANEKVNVRLSSVTNGVFRTRTAAGTITNDDVSPSLRIGDASRLEGAPTKRANAKVPVTLSAVSGAVTTVHWSVRNGTASSGSDYLSVSGTLRIGVGKTTASIAIPILGDGTVEPNETVLVDLDTPVNATISDGHGVVTIRNDD